MIREVPPNMFHSSMILDRRVLEVGLCDLSPGVDGWGTSSILHALVNASIDHTRLQWGTWASLVEKFYIKWLKPKISAWRGVYSATICYHGSQEICCLLIPIHSLFPPDHYSHRAGPLWCGLAPPSLKPWGWSGDCKHFPIPYGHEVKSFQAPGCPALALPAKMGRSMFNTWAVQEGPGPLHQTRAWMGPFHHFSSSSVSIQERVSRTPPSRETSWKRGMSRGQKPGCFQK